YCASLLSILFIYTHRLPPTPTLFPYTTLFRSPITVCSSRRPRRRTHMSGDAGAQGRAVVTTRRTRPRAPPSPPFEAASKDQEEPPPRSTPATVASFSRLPL